MSQTMEQKKFYPMFTTAAAVAKHHASTNGVDSDNDDDDDEFHVPLSSLATSNSSSQGFKKKINGNKENRPRKRRHEESTSKATNKSRHHHDARKSHAPSWNHSDAALEASLASSPSIPQRDEAERNKEHLQQDSPVSSEPQGSQNASNDVPVGGESSHTNDAVPFVASTRPASVVYSLYQRSITGRSLKRPPLTPKWAYRSSLQCHETHCSVRALAWDPTGVLLAAATSHNTICVWEWDVWVAQDRHTKDHGGMQPTWTFRTPRQVSSIQWNTKDDLAVAFRGTSEVRVYHVAHVVEEPNNPNGWVSCTPPSNMVPRHNTPSAFTFVMSKPNLLYVSYEASKFVLLWNAFSATLLWTWQSPNFISCIQSLSDSSILMGGTDGSVRWIDAWRPDNNHRKRGAFCADNKTSGPPVCLDDVWAPHEGMGSVKTIQVVGDECTWVTSNGWILRFKLTPRVAPRALPSGLRTRSTPQIVHSPAQVKILKPDGRELVSDMEYKEYSRPTVPVVSDSVTNLVCWQEVPAVTKTLPHHDKYVGDDLRVDRSDKKRVYVLDSRRPEAVGRLKLQTDPVALGIHPSEEWIVVASQDEGTLAVWTARDR